MIALVYQPGSDFLFTANARVPVLAANQDLQHFDKMNGTEDGSVGESITVHNFSEKILEQVVHFHVMKLSGAFFLWVGSSPELSNLAVSMCSKYVNNPMFYSELSFIYCEYRREAPAL